MADHNASSTFDPFIMDEVYPEPAAIFGFEHKPIQDIFLKADIVLDTNVLLLLLNTGSRSLAEVEKIYARLIAEDRLFIPAQVAREFANNKPEKIKNLYHQLVQKKQNSIKISYCPLFEGLDEYKKIEEQEKILLLDIEEYSKRITKMLEVIKQWGSNDPVSMMYRKIGLDKRIIHCKCDPKKLLAAKDKRYLHKLPPGYKDSKKDDGGVGDFLIWTEILDLGARNKKDLIFVTGEEKSDWWTRSSNNELHVRYELVDEYRRNSGGGSIQLINFSNLLELCEAEYETVDQAKVAQIAEIEDSDQKDSTSIARETEESNLSLSFPAFSRAAEAAVRAWVRSELGSNIQTINTQTPYVDFAAENESGSQIGYEVKAIRHVSYIERRIKELYQLSQRFTSGKPKGETAFRGIFVAESVEKAIEASEYAKTIPSYGAQFGFVIGYLDEEKTFCEVFRSYEEVLDSLVFW